jgi:hypothetical protein
MYRTRIRWWLPLSTLIDVTTVIVHFSGDVQAVELAGCSDGGCLKERLCTLVYLSFALLIGENVFFGSILRLNHMHSPCLD